nr:TetR/AcrR family transcriptional regulator [Nocardia transvalensis]
MPRSPRSDAQDNRDHIIDVARAVFVTVGLDVAIREIARRAEVGPATVYRHFPTKQILIAEVFTDRTHAWRSAMADGLADADPWNGFCHTLTKLCELRALDHGFTAAVKSTFPRAIDFAALRTSSLTSAADLIRRVEDTGRLRPGVVVDDLIAVITANDGLHASTPVARIAASRRFAALVIPAFHASPVSAPLPPRGTSSP